MAFATLKYELTDGIATVTIDRPERNNAISMEMRADFRAPADELYANEAVRVAVFTGRGKTFCVGADEALRCGLVNRVVEDAELATEARALATRLAAKAPQALGLAKRVIQSCVSADLHTARTLESFGQSILIKTADHREGVKAFREQRRPRFEGR